MRPSRPRAEIIEHLERRRAALLASGQAFDKGDAWEVERIATEVCNLVFDDGAKITSVLTRLGIRDSLPFVSSGRVQPTHLLPCCPLTFTQAHVGDKVVRYVPKLGNAPSPPISVDFKTWWDQETIFKTETFSLSRKRLILALRNQDGGSHVGELTDKSYVQLKEIFPVGVEIRDAPNQVHLPGAVAASARQIGWELEQTLASMPPLT